MPIHEAWFWVGLAGLGWGLGFPLVGTRRLGRHLWFGIPVVALAEIPRILLALPFVHQPRLGISPVPVAAGAVVFAGSLVFAAPVVSIRAFTAPDPSEPLRTTGLYALVRHPLMVCDVLWPLGWSLVFGSVIGLLLVPVWAVLIWALTHVEERALVRAHGDAYRAYRSRVPRLVPRVRGGTR